MMLLYMLLGLVMNLEVQSKSQVTATGDVVGQADYMCTYQKGQVRKGDTATLTLQNIDYLRIERIIVSIKSNKSAGAGELSVWLGDSLAVQKNGTYADWMGAYSDTYAPLELAFDPALNTQTKTLQVRLIGTQNSLFIKGYEIHYEVLNRPARTVRFHAGDGSCIVREETQGGTGVTVPEVPPLEAWYGLGWTVNRADSLSICPELTKAGQTYYPKVDEDLWALYANKQVAEDPYALRTDCESGYYSLVLKGAWHDDESYALKGATAGNDRMETEPVGVKKAGGVPSMTHEPPSECVYRLDFQPEDSTLWIQHVETGEYVGMKDGKITETDMPWNYRMGADSALIVYVLDSETLYLMQQQYKAGEEVWQVRLLKLPPTELERVPGVFWCLDAGWPDEALWYTTNPLRTARGNVEADRDDIEHVVLFGVYEIHVMNKKKTLRLRN